MENCRMDGTHVVGAILAGALITGFLGMFAYDAGLRAGRQSMPQWAEVEKLRIQVEADSRKTMWESLGKGNRFGDVDNFIADDDVRYLGR